ncbi:hypothetical protein [Spirosoma utsteinense]|uniref:Uncharacterized protein n=1 Tax=Spirosoma utsteinense TaxID=2585773 RepID=A0ABR6WCI3_9BACT|nr:hypothetical protein [Spirosoma utsteinense]MBC3786351.1 hypothetical protein [Spirosoma utsteinense]MBC3793873.1 hypothetical protein [Spirosoma utsteinense]
MNSDLNEELAAKQLAEEYNNALNQKIEERFRAALFLVDPSLDMDTVTVVSNVGSDDDQLTVDGVDDETIDKAMAIFEQDNQEDS